MMSFQCLCSKWNNFWMLWDIEKVQQIGRYTEKTNEKNERHIKKMHWFYFIFNPKRWEFHLKGFNFIRPRLECKRRSFQIFIFYFGGKLRRLKLTQLNWRKNLNEKRDENDFGTKISSHENRKKKNNWIQTTKSWYFKRKRQWFENEKHAQPKKKPNIETGQLSTILIGNFIVIWIETFYLYLYRTVCFVSEQI